MTNGSLKWTWSTTLIDSDYVTGIFRALQMIQQARSEKDQGGRALPRQ